MRPWLITLAVLGVLASGAAAVSYCWVCGDSGHKSGQGEAVSWLSTEFKLNDEQVRRIEAMHEAYRDVCAKHCAAISDARDHVNVVRTGGADDSAIRLAEAQLAEVDAICRSATEAHVRAVASVMGEKQGARYLEMVLPKLARVAHNGAPDLQANSAGAHHGH